MSVLSVALLDRLAEIIPRYNMTEPGDRVGVAVSGGADSVALVHLLHRLSKQLEFELFVLHLNHQLRGRESDADQEFVRELARPLGLAVHTERIQIASSGNLEQNCRDARRLFFRQAMKDCSLKRIALGHTRSDQAETVLLRLLRGSGMAGLAGMRMVTEDGFIRPLLAFTRQEVRQWAEAEHLQWREDSSNENCAFTRNRLRHNVMPSLMRDFNPSLEAVLARTAELGQSEEEYWAEQVHAVFTRIADRSPGGVIVDVPQLASLHLAMQRRVIRRGIFEVRGHLRSMDMRHVDAILALCQSSGAHDRVILPGLDVLRSYGKLRLAPAGDAGPGRTGYCEELAIGQEAELPFEGGRISLQWFEPESRVCASFKEEQNFGAEIAYLDGEALTGAGVSRPIYVRSWAPGDAFRRPGHADPEKIKSLFQEHRVLLWQRRHWPVLVCGEEIVWVRKFGSAAKFASSTETRRVVRLMFKAQTQQKGEL